MPQQKKPHKPSAPASKTSKARSIKRKSTLLSPKGPSASSQLTLVPIRSKFSLAWSEVVLLNTSNTTAYTTGGMLVINLSDITVPLSTSATHQPYGFDQLAQFYRRFKITDVDVLITIAAGGSGTTVVNATRAFVQWMPPGYNYSMASVANAPSVLTERQNIDSYPLLSNTGKATVTIKKRISVAQLAGVTNDEFKANANEYAGSFPSTAPSRVVSLGVSVSGDTVIGVGHSVQVRLVYHGEAFERIDYASS